MEQRGLQHRNLFAPNLVVVCVDRVVNGEPEGRFYHCYEKEPTLFSDAVEFVMKADRFYDMIAFPQASTVARSFQEGKKNASGQCYNRKRPDKIVTTEELLAYSGEVGTFALSVEYRQNATWQGTMTHIETGESLEFADVLGLLAKIDEILSGKEA